MSNVKDYKELRETYETAVTDTVSLTSPKPTQIWENAQTHLEKAYQNLHAYNSSDNIAAILLKTPTSSRKYQALRNDYLAFIQTNQSTVLRINCRQPAIISFWPLRSLLEQLWPTISQEAPDLLATYAAELNVIHPQLMQQSGIKPPLALSQIALTPSERRSHRESEQLFRIVNNFCNLLINAQKLCPTLSQAPLVIWWENLQMADRPTLLTFRRLNNRLHNTKAPILLIGAYCTAEYVSKNSRAAIEDMGNYFNWHVQHQQLMDQICSQLFAEEIHLLDTSNAITFLSAPKDSFQETPDPLNEAQATLLALHHFAKNHIAIGTAYALQAMRLAIFNLNLEAVLFLGQQVLTYLQPDKFDAVQFVQVWQTITADDNYVALEFSVSSNLSQIEDILIATWKAAALVHTFLGEHQKAVECYEHALDLATTSVMQAQLHMYLGLIKGKRLYKIEDAQADLRQGLALTEDIDDADIALERGWLLNVSALMAFQTKRFNDAMSMVQKALATVKKHHHSEATHLKVNLISNISVLLESTNQLDEAVKTWRFFRSFLGTANEIFAKHYFFREGGLLLKTGKREEAMDCYQQSYEQAQAVNDTFHMQVIASTCGYLKYHQGDIEQAQQWYAQSCQLAEIVGDHKMLPESLMAQAFCCYQMEQKETAYILNEQAAVICQQFNMNELLERIRELQHVLTHETPEIINTWSQKIIKPLGTKLNRPFYLINLYD